MRPYNCCGGTGWRNEPVAAPSNNGFDVSRLVRRIAQSLAQFIHRRVKTMFEVTSSCSLPKALAQILTRHRLSGHGQKRFQNLPGLRGKFDPMPMLPELPRREVIFKRPKAQHWLSCGLRKHGIFQAEVRL